MPFVFFFFFILLFFFVLLVLLLFFKFKIYSSFIVCWVGLDLIAQIRLIYNNYMFDTQILAASVRHPMHIINCAEIGSDVMTGPLSAIKALAKHPLTDIGLEQFLADHAKVNS